jgi:glycerophosphoryl diester phosphodiesterase
VTRATCIAAASVALIGAGCLEPADFKGKKNPDFHVIGHRGAPNVAAENTIAAMEAALLQGANAVEIDLCVTADGEVVLWHDLDPEDTVAQARRAGIEGLLYIPVVPEDGSPHRRRVDELTLADFIATHGYAQSGDTPDPAAPIATLADFLAWLAASTGIDAVYYDVKVDVAAQAARILELASVVPLHTQAYFLSTRRDVVDSMIAARDELAAGPGTTDPERARIVWDFESAGGLEGAEDVGLRDVTTGLTVTRGEAELLDEIEVVLEARQKGRVDSVVVWTIDDRQLLGILLYYGVDGVMTNEPGELFDLWQKTL